MKVDIQEVSPTQRVLKIEVPTEDVSREFQRASSIINKKVKMPGFRPGKAPLSLIERQYKEDIAEDVLKRLIPDSYTKAIKDSGIIPVEMPHIEDIKLSKGSPLTFTAKVEIRPEFDIMPYEGLELTKKDSSIKEDEVDAVIARLRDRFSTLENYEDNHIIAQGDHAVIDSEMLIDGSPAKDGKIENYILEIGSKNFIEGFEEKLIGHKKGENIEIKINFPDTHQAKELAGKEALFKINIKEVKKKILPNIDDEFAKDVGGFASLDDLKKKIREDIRLQKESLNRESYRNEILKKLVEGTTFEPPASIVERELHSILHDAKQRGFFSDKEITDDKEGRLRKEYEPVARERVKGYLILDAIAEKEKVDVSDKDVDAEIERMAVSMNRNPVELKEHMMTRKDILANLKSRLREDRALDLIISKAVFKEPAEATA